MPRAMRVCPTSGCAELTEGGRCPGCKARAEQLRGNATQRGYDHRWKRTRAAFLRDHPFCECDSQPCLLPATDVDHIDGLGPNGPRGHDLTNLRAMAHAHHSRRTARDQPGGWNAR